MKIIYAISMSLFIVAVWFTPYKAYAQLPDNAQIGADRIEEQLPENLREPLLPSTMGIPLIEGLPEQEVLEPSESAATFRVVNIIVLHNTVFENSVIHEQVKGAIGEAVTLNDLRTAAVNITNLYRKEGYPFSKAFIPKQTLEDDTVIIDVIEGYIGEVEYRGFEVSENSAIHRYAKVLLDKRPVKKEDLERYVLLVNDLQGIQAKAIMSLVKGRPGAVKLILLIDRKMHEAGVSFNNRGSASLGPIQGSAYYKLNDLLGFNEQSSLIYLITPENNELRYVALSQSWPIGSDGAKVSYSFRRSDSNPGSEASVFEIESESNAFNVSLSYPVIRTRERNLTAEVLLDARSSATESFDAEIIDDDLRYVRAKASFNQVHHSGISGIEVTASKGVDIFDATPDNFIMASRFGGSSTASKLQADIYRRQIITDELSLTAKATGQWAFEPLLSAELFGLGGSEYGRAADFSTITGDNGFAASAELSYKIPYDSEYVDQVSVFGFIDGGQAYDETNLIGKNWQGLYTYGTGVDIGIYKFLNARLEIAKPLKIEAPDRDYNVRGFGTVGMKVGL